MEMVWLSAEADRAALIRLCLHIINNSLPGYVDACLYCDFVSGHDEDCIYAYALCVVENARKWGYDVDDVSEFEPCKPFTDEQAAEGSEEE